MSSRLFDLTQKLISQAETATLSSRALDLFLDEITNTRQISLYSAQEEALLEVYNDKNIILNTPTGSGKSLVALSMHFYSLVHQRRSIYTCPIKALVNEKFLSLCQDFGANQVGMITGDVTINPGAPIICCTAEILSQMALREGHLTPFQDIIIDEFHYYSDKERGHAWQIPLLTLTQSRFLLMSATLGETQFFEEALTQLNGKQTALVQSDLRPVPLDYEYSERPLYFKIASLVAEQKTPIYLVNFTQRECAETAQDLLSVDYCTKEEKKRISEQLYDVNFKSPYGKDFQKLLKHGVGIHHAGLLPRYRVLVEKLAQKGLLKIIVGTDTLGVGVNIPIRTVLFTKLSKYNGEKQSLLTIRDFKQICGRAGRKGFDSQGSVVVQAPEHVIENLMMDQKAQQDPKKSKNKVKKKPPENFIPWNKETLTHLTQSPAEPLLSQFKMDHSVVLQVLSRDPRGRALAKLIRDSHESDSQKKKHRKHAFKLFRSLVDREIITLRPLRINIDLQSDFSLHHTLSLFLIDTLSLLNPEQESFALDLLTLVESIIENPDLILRRQVDKLKTLKMAELKASGMDYEERLLELEKVDYPKPNHEFIYHHYNIFSQAHPWVGEENIRPKSIAREMIESYLSFHDYIKEYDLERTEGVLLRYLNEVYKVLVQTVPEHYRNESVLELIAYFKTLLHQIDSSLVDEWNKLKEPHQLAHQTQESSKQFDSKRAKVDDKMNRIQARQNVLHVLRHLSQDQYEQAIDFFENAETLDLKKHFEIQGDLFKTQYGKILLDVNARSNLNTLWNPPLLEQIVFNIEGATDWVFKVEWTGYQKLKFISFSEH